MKKAFTAKSFCCLGVGRTDEKAAWWCRVHTAGFSCKRSSWSVSRYLAVLPASVCGCVTFIDNLLKAPDGVCVTSPPHSFLELHTFSSKKAKCLTINATDKSQASLQRTELYLVSSPSIYKFKSVIL